MKLNADIVYEGLKKKYPVTMSGPKSTQLTISRPELYLDNEVAFYADHLYLATVDHLPVHPQLQKNAVIVVIGEGAKLFHYREQCCLIVIEKDADFFEVNRCICQLFDRYYAWEQKLFDIFLDTADLQQIVACSEPLFDCSVPFCEKQHKKAYYVVCADYVTLTDGTGVVHIAPAFGEDDAKVGRRYDMPFVQLVDEKGNMGETTPFAGLFVKKADPEVLKDLDGRGLLYDAPKFEHSYPHCWRCDTPLIYYARESWFIKMTEVKDDLIANNNTINWIPERIGKATGLRTFRTGVSAVTVTGELH